MNIPVRRLALCILVCLISASTVAADYLGSLREAAAAIEVGAYDQAGSSIEEALVANGSDPLVHLALAALYLHAGKLDAASSEFSEISVLSPRSWRAHYGLAVVALLKGDKAAVQKEISAARDLSPDEPDIAAFESYRSYMNGGRVSVSGLTSSLGRQVDAYVAVKGGDRGVARRLLSDVLDMPAPTGFDERRAPVASFLPSAPVAIPLGKLKWSPPRKDSMPEVSDTVFLKADVSQAEGVHFVTFYVDGSLVGMSNCEPYSFNWNTVRHTNGPHLLRIDGKDGQGNVISTKSTWVRIQNTGAVNAPPVSGPEAEDLEQRIWACIRLSECRRLAHYEMARIDLADGDREAAIRQLQYAIAYRPDFGDAMKLLDKLQGRPAECLEIRSGSPGRKRVALTFDDGPNQRTSILLDALAGLRVPATFFLVGFRAEAQPDLVSAIQAAGHDVQNHSYTHPNLSTLSTYEIEEQLCKTNAVILSITGRSPRYFRPPGGNFSGNVKKAAAKHGMCSVFWTLNCGPYEGGESQALADFVVGGITDGAIILMHNGEPATVSALPSIVERLRGQGYDFVTVSDLLAAR